MVFDEGPRTEMRPTVLSLNVANVSALYAAYMPFLLRGGVFVPTTKHYDLGDEVFLLLQLPDEPERSRSPAPWCGSRRRGCRGIGCRGSACISPNRKPSQQLRVRIERKLGTLLGSGRTTHTL